jgi:hypothetical protein
VTTTVSASMLWSMAMTFAVMLTIIKVLTN